MATEIHREPANNNWHGAVCATCNQEQGSILNSTPILTMDVKEDGEARNRNANGDEGEDETVTQAVR